MSSPSSASASSTPTVIKSAAIQEVENFFAKHSDVEVMQHVLGVSPLPGAPELANCCIINCIDTEDYERDHDFLTEIGLAAFDSREMQPFAANEGPHAEKMLKQVYYYHFRILPNTHMVNRTFCVGVPENNRFGVTRFTTHNEAKGMMDQSFNWPIDERDPSKGNCPVIFLGHAGHGDLTRLHRSINFNSSSTVVRYIDTQVMAKALSLHRQQIGLGTLMSYYSFPYRDAHTAGNDAAYTTIAAILMAVYGRDVPNFEKTPLQVVDEVEEASIAHSECGWGTATFCTRCHAYTHVRKACRVKIHCTECYNAGRERKFIASHVSEDCLFRGQTVVKTAEESNLAKEDLVSRESFVWKTTSKKK